MSTERRVLIWICVFVGVNQLGFGGIVPVLPLYAQSFGVSASAIGLTIAIYGLARFVVAAPSGHLSDRLGRKPTLVIGGLVSAAGNIWCALATSYPEFVVARFVAGCGAGIMLTTGQIILADITTPERRGRTIAIYQGVFIFTVGIGPLPGGLLAEHFSLATPFFAYGIAGTISAMVAWFLVAETRDMAQTRGNFATSARPPFTTQLGLLARQKGFLLVCFVAFANAFARTGGLFTIVPVIGSLRLELSVGQIGFALALGSVIGLVAAYPAGMLVDRYGRKAVIVPATVISGFSMLLFCLAPSYAWFIAACLVWGLASSIGSAAPSAYAADSAPPGLNATTMSTFRMIGDSGYVIGPMALGLVVDVQGPEEALVAAASLLVLAGGLFLMRAPESWRGSRRSPRRAP